MSGVTGTVDLVTDAKAELVEVLVRAPKSADTSGMDATMAAMNARLVSSVSGKNPESAVRHRPRLARRHGAARYPD
jgi:hypothetical protein